MQARSRQTVEWILEGAARVFRTEGFGATTNRIAEVAGVSIGTLYEYFPNKESLLVALAERHVATAERELAEALRAHGSTRELLDRVQRAIAASHRYPSQAVQLVADVPTVGAELRARALALRERVLAALGDHARALDLPDPELRARAVFGLIAEVTSIAAYEPATSDAHARLAAHLLEIATDHLREGRP